MWLDRLSGETGFCSRQLNKGIYFMSVNGSYLTRFAIRICFQLGLLIFSVAAFSQYERRPPPELLMWGHDYGDGSITASTPEAFVRAMFDKDSDSSFTYVVDHCDPIRLNIFFDPATSYATCYYYAYPANALDHGRLESQDFQNTCAINDGTAGRHDTAAWFDSNALCVCYPGSYYIPKLRRCIVGMKRIHTNLCPDCTPSYGDPIYPSVAANRQTVDLGMSLRGIALQMQYDSSLKMPPDDGYDPPSLKGPISFGPLWKSTFHSVMVNADASVHEWDILRGLGAWSAFQSSVSTFAPGTGYLFSPQGGGDDGFVWGQIGGYYYDKTDGRLDYFSGPSPDSTERVDGGKISYIYTDGLLTSVQDDFGRSIVFAYEQPNGLPARINQITAPDGAVTKFGYDSIGNLTEIIWPDLTVRKFVYADPNSAWALTGIVDEAGRSFASFAYNEKGSAIGTKLAGEALSYSVAYGKYPTWKVAENLELEPINNAYWLMLDYTYSAPQDVVVTDPNGLSSNLVFSDSANVPRLISKGQPAGSGSPAAMSSQIIDSSGNVTSRIDFNGNKTCYAYDVISNGQHNLENYRIEGFQATDVCPTDLASYSISPSLSPALPQRKISTQWHSSWHLPIKLAEPKKVTTWVYNGQLDPFTNATASCGTGHLVDGGTVKALVCKRVEQATSDETGSQGFDAPPLGSARTWTYAYNQYGQLLTATTPKLSATDTLSHTTTYAYYADTNLSGGMGHTMGDLQSITDPLNYKTTYTSYDAAGRLLSSIDPNGTTTTQNYWPRGWLKSQTITPTSGQGGALTTSYTYWPTGLLQTVMTPDGGTLSYAYDDAHRLTDITDAAGNKVHYDLDNSGNRIGEQVSDASGNLTTKVARVFDALNRVQSATNAPH